MVRVYGVLRNGVTRLNLKNGKGLVTKLLTSTVLCVATALKMADTCMLIYYYYYYIRYVFDPNKAFCLAGTSRPTGHSAPDQ
jgi:hypothetical protein